MIRFKNSLKLLLLSAAASTLLYAGAAAAQDTKDETAKTKQATEKMADALRNSSGGEKASGNATPEGTGDDQSASEENIVPPDASPDTDTESEAMPDESAAEESPEDDTEADAPAEDVTEDEESAQSDNEDNGDAPETGEGIIEVPEETVLPVEDSGLPGAEDVSASGDETLPAKKTKRWWGRPY